MTTTARKPTTYGSGEPPFSFMSCSTVLPMPSSHGAVNTLYQSAPSAKNTTAATRIAQ